jgi:hypothetical protein
MTQSEIDAYNRMAWSFCVTDRMTRIALKTVAIRNRVKDEAFIVWVTVRVTE